MSKYLGVFPVAAPTPRKLYWAKPYRICHIYTDGTMTMLHGAKAILAEAQEGAQQRARESVYEHYFVLDLTGSGPQEIEVDA